MQLALENFQWDLKLTKASLLNFSHIPQFPESEWDNLLVGQSVDIDHVITLGYSIKHNERRTEHIGEIKQAHHWVTKGFKNC